MNQADTLLPNVATTLTFCVTFLTFVMLQYWRLTKHCLVMHAADITPAQSKKNANSYQHQLQQYTWSNCDGSPWPWMTGWKKMSEMKDTIVYKQHHGVWAISTTSTPQRVHFSHQQFSGVKTESKVKRADTHDCSFRLLSAIVNDQLTVTCWTLETEERVWRDEAAT